MTTDSPVGNGSHTSIIARCVHVSQESSEGQTGSGSFRSAGDLMRVTGLDVSSIGVSMWGNLIRTNTVFALHHSCT